MNLSVTGHHVEVTPSMHDYVEKKIQKLEHHFTYITNIHVILKLDNHKSPVAEATVHVTKAELFASSDHADMYAAIDLLVDKLDKQIIKHKQTLERREHGN